MVNKGNISYYLGICEMTRYILEKLGTDIYKDGYYNDEYIRSEYIYGDLKIIENDSSLDIYINEKRVLHYNIIKNQIEYIPGNWTKLIHLIYEDIPNVLNQRKKETELQNKKYNTIKELEPHCDLFNKYYNKKDDVSEYLMHEMHNNGFQLPRKHAFYQTYSNIQCTYDNHHYMKVEVYYNGEKVFEFPDKTTDSLIDIFNKETFEEYISKITLGDWVPKFKNIIAKTNDFYENKLDKEIDDKVDEMIKRLTRG